MNKTTLSLWLVAFSLIFFSCKKDDDPSPSNSNNGGNTAATTTSGSVNGRSWNGAGTFVSNGATLPRTSYILSNGMLIVTTFNGSGGNETLQATLSGVSSSVNGTYTISASNSNNVTYTLLPSTVGSVTSGSIVISNYNANSKSMDVSISGSGSIITTSESFSVNLQLKNVKG